MDALTIIFVAMAAILFGYGGYVLGNYYPLIKREKRSAKFEIVEQEIEHDEERDNVDVGDIEGEEEAKPDTGVKKRVLPKTMNPEETIQIWYDAESRKIVPEIDGELIDLDSDIGDEEKQKLTWLLIDLQEKVGLVGNVNKHVKNSESPEEQVQDSVDIRFNPIRSFVNYIQSDVPTIEDKKDSLPEQINAILQEQITGTALSNKGISVVDFPEKGLMFMVGIDLFEDIEMIPDKNIQKAIKTAVKTWEENLGERD